MKNEDLQELANSDGIIATARVTISYDIIIPDYNQSREEVDRLLKEWFEMYHVTIRTYGHAYRDNNSIGGSEKVISVEPFYNKKI